MLTKRAQILFEEDTYFILSMLAEEKRTSIGNLVRTAVKDKYIKSSKNNKIAKALKKILEIRPYFKRINYKELVSYGRKY